MRFLYSIIAFWLWGVIMAFCISKGMKISDDMQLLTIAIVVAGALAGGD